MGNRLTRAKFRVPSTVHPVSNRTQQPWGGGMCSSTYTEHKGSCAYKSLQSHWANTDELGVQTQALLTPQCRSVPRKLIPHNGSSSLITATTNIIEHNVLSALCESPHLFLTCVTLIPILRVKKIKLRKEMWGAHHHTGKSPDCRALSLHILLHLPGKQTGSQYWLCARYDTEVLSSQRFVNTADCLGRCPMHFTLCQGINN